MCCRSPVPILWFCSCGHGCSFVPQGLCAVWWKQSASKGNPHCSPKQSWSAACSQPRALSLQPLSEANQLVLPVLAQIVTLTSELLVNASAEQHRGFQSNGEVIWEVENGQETPKGDNHLEAYPCPAPGYVWSHFLDCFEGLSMWLLQPAHSSTGYKRIDEFVALSSLALLCFWWLLVAVLWVLKRIGMCPAAASLLYSKLTTA